RFRTNLTWVNTTLRVKQLRLTHCVLNLNDLRALLVVFLLQRNQVYNVAVAIEPTCRNTVVLVERVVGEGIRPFFTYLYHPVINNGKHSTIEEVLMSLRLNPDFLNHHAIKVLFRTLSNNGCSIQNSITSPSIRCRLESVLMLNPQGVLSHNMDHVRLAL